MKYRWQIQNGSQVTSVIASASEQSKQITGLTPNTPYTVKVTAVDNADNRSEEKDNSKKTNVKTTLTLGKPKITVAAKSGTSTKKYTNGSNTYYNGDVTITVTDDTTGSHATKMEIQVTGSGSKAKTYNKTTAVTTSRKYEDSKFRFGTNKLNNRQ